MKSTSYLAIVTALGLAAVSASAQSSHNAVVTVQHAGTSYLGIGVVEISPDRAKALNLKEERGAEVARVEDDSPASKAGLKAGDVVLEYNGMPVEGTEQIIRMVRETPAGRQVKLAIWRNGAMQNVTITVGSRKGMVIETPEGAVTIPPIPPVPPNPPIEIPRFQMAWQSAMLGIEGESIGQQDQFADFLGVKDGVLVKAVIKNSAAEKAGIKAGDVITKVNGDKVSSTREITSQLRSVRSRKNVPVTLVRDKKEMSLNVNLDEDRRGNSAAAPGEKF